MAKTKLAEIESDEVGSRESVRTRAVKVNSVTRREYVEQEPIVEVVEEEQDDNPWPDPFADFNELVTHSQQATMRVWWLPKYEIDGRSGTTGTEREYCGSVIYNREDNASTLDSIRQLVPMGGAVQLELYADGRIQRRGLLKLVKTAQQAPGAASGPMPHFVINQPQQATPQQTMSPAEIMREHMSLAKDLVSMARDLVPPAPTINVGENGTGPAGSSVQDKILETVLVKALESDKAPIDRVLEVLGGPRETSWTDSIVSALAPAVPAILQTIGPGLNALMLRFATGSQQPVPIQQVTSAPVQEMPPPAPQLPQAESESPSRPQMSPMEKAYLKTLWRILEDCSEHADVSAVSADKISVSPSVEAILELLDRFPDQLSPTIASLLQTPPLGVFDACAQMMPQAAPNILGLKERPQAVSWIEDLQKECKRVLTEEEQGEGQGDVSA